MAFILGASEQSIYPIVAVRDGIVFPNTENVLVFGRPKSVEAINESLKRDKCLVLVMQKNSSVDDPNPADLYNIGVLANVEKTIVGEKGEINALVKGREKVKITNYVKEAPYLEAKVNIVEDAVPDDEEIQAMVKHISMQIKKAINLGKTVDFVFLMNILNISSPTDFSPIKPWIYWKKRPPTCAIRKDPWLWFYGGILKI